MNIKEVLHKSLLTEDYNSNEEIRLFTELYFKELANYSYPLLNKWANKNANTPQTEIQLGGSSLLGEYYSSDELPTVSVNAIYRMHQSKFNTLTEFLKNAYELQIIWLSKEAKEGADGSYTQLTDDATNKYNPEYTRFIKLFMTTFVANEIRSDFLSPWNDKPFTEANLLDLLLRRFKSTFIHELQHAYDDFRSDTKGFNTKEFIKYQKDVEIQQKKDKKEFADNLYKDYLNLPHEIWARFTQAIDSTNFIKMDMNNDLTDIWYEMYPIHDVMKSFKSNFHGFQLIPLKTQKRLYRKASQFWHKEQEKLPAKNKQLRKENGLD